MKRSSIWHTLDLESLVPHSAAMHLHHRNTSSHKEARHIWWSRLLSRLLSKPPTMILSLSESLLSRKRREVPFLLRLPPLGLPMPVAPHPIAAHMGVARPCRLLHLRREGRGATHLLSIFVRA